MGLMVSAVATRQRRRALRQASDAIAMTALRQKHLRQLSKERILPRRVREHHLEGADLGVVVVVHDLAAESNSQRLKTKARGKDRNAGSRKEGHGLRASF